VCRPGCCRLRAGVDSGVPAACEEPAPLAVG
jgi:ferrochelatase